MLDFSDLFLLHVAITYFKPQLLFFTQTSNALLFVQRDKQLLARLFLSKRSSRRWHRSQPYTQNHSSDFVNVKIAFKGIACFCSSSLPPQSQFLLGQTLRRSFPVCSWVRSCPCEITKSWYEAVCRGTAVCRTPALGCPRPNTLNVTGVLNY